MMTAIPWMTATPHDDRKGHHYYIRGDVASLVQGAVPLRARASMAVYSSDAPCGRHGDGAAEMVFHQIEAAGGYPETLLFGTLLLLHGEGRNYSGS